MKTTRTFAMAAGLVALALTVSACSSGADTGETTDPAEPASTNAEAQAALDHAYEGFGLTLDDLEATTPEAGLEFYVMSCGESLSTCSAPAAAMVEAAETAGWNAHIVDGKLSPDGFATAIRQAVAGGADVLVPVGISCSAAAAAFGEAKAAGVTIVGGGGQDDCDPSEWDSERVWLPDPPLPTGIFGAFGILQADYVFGKTNGDVKAVVITQTSNPWGQLITDAFTDRLEELGGGEILDDIAVSDPETADNSYIQKVTSSLLANPDANALIVPTDSMLVNGLAAAIAQAGMADELVVIGNYGSEPAVDMIRAGQPGIDAVVGTAQVWEAWGSVDTAIRVRNDLDVAPAGQQTQVVDKDHNMPESGPYDGTIDWKTAYLTAWGK